MVNQVVLDYLKKYSGSYKLEDLKKKIISSGYSEYEVEEAIVVLGLRQARGAEKIREDSRKSYSTWLKIAAICGILVFAFSIIGNFFQGVKSVFSVLLVLAVISSIVFYSGFFILGKKYKKGMIKVMSIIFILMLVLMIVGSLLLIIFSKQIVVPAMGSLSGKLGTGFDVANIVNLVIEALASYLLILISFLLVMIVLGILFGVGIVKLKENVKLAKLTGIFYIIGYASLIIGIGALALLVAHILAIVMMFKASKLA